MLDERLEEIEKQIEELQLKKKEVLEDRKKKLNEEKAERRTEVDEAYQHFLSLRNKYIEDYGVYQYTSKDNDRSFWNEFFHLL